ncbi:MAG TPA: PAS domain S-box protein, partial [Armatimonadota bacterium]
MKLHLLDPLSIPGLSEALLAYCAATDADRAGLFLYSPAHRLVQGVLGLDDGGAPESLTKYLYGCAEKGDGFLQDVAVGFRPFSLLNQSTEYTAYGLPPVDYGTLVVPISDGAEVLGVLAADRRISRRPIDTGDAACFGQEAQGFAPFLAGLEVTNTCDLLPEAMESLGDGLAVLSHEGWVLYTNPALRQLLCRQEGSLEYRPLRESMALSLAGVPEADAGALAPGVYRGDLILPTGEPSPVRVTVVDLCLRIGVLSRLVVVGDESGVLARQEARRQRELALNHSAAAETLRSLLNASPAAIITLDSEGRISTWTRSAARLFGWTEEEVMAGADPFGLQGKPQALPRLLTRALQGEELRGEEAHHYRKDGLPLVVSLSASPLPGVGGRRGGCMAVILDVTEEVRAKQNLQSLR